jgi:hypothetical protein
MRHWDQPVRIRIEGEYTPEDSAVVVEVAASLAEALVTIPVSVVQGNATVQPLFHAGHGLLPASRVGLLAAGGVWGYSCPTSDADRRYTAVAVYVTSLRTAPIRRYLIHHELDAHGRLLRPSRQRRQHPEPSREYLTAHLPAPRITSCSR